MVLLIVTGLLLKSLKAVQTMQPGFEPRGVTTAFLIKPAANQQAFFDRILSELRTSPGVQSAALAFSIPFGGDSPTSLFAVKGRQHLPGEPEWHAEAYQVSPGYFETLRIPLVRGRAISELDTASSPHVCVIDANLAKRFFANEDPIGKEIAMYGGWARIVGVVSTVRDETLESPSRPVVYYSLAQIPYFPQLGVIVRSSVPAGSLIRNAVRRANPLVPVFDVKTMEERIDASVATRSVMSWLLTIFAAISLLLAALGVHGVVAQVVEERTSEIGIRMALGARPGNILRQYMVLGLRPSFAGIALGLGAAIGCQRWLQSFLYHVEAVDATTLLLGVLGVIALSGLAVLAPSWRASHVDPQIALRSE